MALKKVLVVGLGKVGSLVAVLLKESKFKVTGYDQQAPDELPYPVIRGDVKDMETLRSAFAAHDAVISCLPYHLNKNLAQAAHDAGIHYFDLTEDVSTTEFIRKLSKTSRGLMAPQCGLAPGFIGIVGADLATRFDILRSIELRVGALPQHPKGDLGYAFNWSPEGVVNEYLNNCDVIRDGKIQSVPAMQDLETILISGNKLEAFSTSGGLGTMCETFEGRVEELNYKTMRYPGHMRLMRFFFHELQMKKRRKKAGDILVNSKPPVMEDVVYVHAAVEGEKKRPRVYVEGTYREEFVRAYYPLKIGDRMWRAISWTTAASVVAVVEMVAKKQLPQEGFLKQEDIRLEQFFKTHTGKLYVK